jgi:small-conductance mechanosensitive channel
VSDIVNRAATSIGLALNWAPEWLAAAVILVLAALIAVLLHRWVSRGLRRLIGERRPFLHRLLRRSEGPTGLILIAIIVGAALPATGLTSDNAAVIAHVLLIGFIAALGWAAVNAIELSADLYLDRFGGDLSENLVARKHVTQIRILRRAANTLTVIVTIAAALMTIAAVRQYGLSLFASAGAAGLVLGLAARPVLSNLLAGIQIAMTQPIRINDAVIIEGEYGTIENINSTYVVVRLWDWRRMIVPLSYFIEKPFQNWTHESAALIGTVYLNVDYTVPVERVREKLNEIAEASKLWDRQVVNLQVTDTPAQMVQLRALVSARNSGTAWDLRCEVREKLIAFLQAEYPHALPRQRAEIERRDARDDQGPSARLLDTIS